MNGLMSDPEFEAVLAQCTEDVLRQHRTVEECLQTYPHYADRLKPLLLAGLMTRRLKSPQLNQQSVHSLEARLRKQAKRQPRRRTGIPYGLSRLAAMLVIALIIALGSGGGLVAASSNSLPGDPLYGIKRLWEAIVLALSPLTGPEDVLWQRIAETRLDEVERLSSEDELSETALVDLYGALYHLTQFSSAQNDPKIMTLMQDTASTFVSISPPSDAQAVYRDVLRLAQENVRTGTVQPPPAELPPSIIQRTALPTLIPSETPLPSATLTPIPSVTSLPTETPLPSATASFTASPTASNTPTATTTPSRTPRIPATSTRTQTSIPSLTFTPTATLTPIAPTATWTDLPLPAPIFSLPSTATAVPVSVPTETPNATPVIAATRIRETERSVFMTQTAGPPTSTSTSPP